MKQHHQIVSDGATETSPTPERARHSPVELSPQTIADDVGRISRPFLVIDTLIALERRKRITADQRAAGEEFARCFRLAHLDGLRAADMARVVVHGRRQLEPETRSSARAGKKINAAIRFLGGFSLGLGLPASCAWEVLGLEKSLERWSEEKGLTSRSRTATQVLCYTLSELVRFGF